MNADIHDVKPGTKIAFITAPGWTVEYPTYSGIAYGIKRGRFGDNLRVKVTDDRGNVTWHYVNNFTTVGIGAYLVK